MRYQVTRYQVTRTKVDTLPYIMTLYNPEWKIKPPLFIGTFEQCQAWIRDKNEKQS